MGRRISPVKKLLKQRLYYFLEILAVFMGIFIFLLFPSFLLTIIIDIDSNLIPLYYLIRALLIIIAIPIFLLVSKFALEPQKKKIILIEDISSSNKFLNLYKISKNNFKYQLLYGIIILFLVFIPLDFLTYLLLPDLIEYTAIALDVYAATSLNSYLIKDYIIFLISVLIIQSSVSIYEESLYRGFLANRGNDYIHKMSAVMISSLVFGLGHFRYFFTFGTINLPIIFPFIWFIQTFLVGIILSMLLLRKRWIFPVIFSHTINNIITAHIIWNFLQGNNFFPFALYLYSPLLIISLILLIWQFSRIKDALSIGFREFGDYFKNDKNLKETTSQKILRIFLDFLFGLIIFFLTIVLI